MSRTHHVRPRRTRFGDGTIAAKKPDEGRRWERRFAKSHDLPPARDLRRDDVSMTDDPIAELTEILREVGARPTFDRDRNVTHPCVVCRTTDKPRDLVEIGTHTRRMGGNLQPGDAISRPMCADCVALTESATT